MSSQSKLEISRRVSFDASGARSPLRAGATKQAAWMQGISSPPLPEASSRLSGFTVLLVDDDEDLRYLTAVTLGLTGLQVISCNNADSADTAWRARSGVDLLITDLEMPGRSGVQLAGDLCAQGATMPILIVSGAYISEAVSGTMREHSWRFLAKPYAPSELLALVSTLLPTV